MPTKPKDHPEAKNGLHLPPIAVIIPCYRETDHILDVIAEIGQEVTAIFVIDDACRDGTGDLVENANSDPRVRVIRNELNTGVGGATIAGYRQAMETDAEIFVKIDGDGQMDPKLIPAVSAPIADGRADYAKGNRFHSIQAVRGMPGTRIVGNFALSFLSKLSSGYWNVFDPTNGFTAIHRRAAEDLPFETLSNGFFFESDMLFHLGLLRAVVEDVPMAARYGLETSGINILKVVPEFFFKHALNTIKRIAFNYFVRDAGLATVQLVLGKILVLFGVIFGAVKWYASVRTGVPATAGTVVLAALPIIVGSQLLIAFLGNDVKNVPSKPLQNHPPR